MTSATAELAIRARRAAFNRAIATGDAQAIGSFLARDCVMVTGTDSAVITGRMAQVKVWRSQFGAAAREVFVRTPDTVTVSAAEPIAMEQGRWDTLLPPGGNGASGSYCAKWREVAGAWVIEAEVFVTLR